jgi:hypothetical protein
MLLVASLLKAHQAAGEELTGQSFTSSRGFVAGLVLLEMGLGVWLLAGTFQRTARRVALCVFVLFFEAALYQELLAAPTCGCFGRLRVLPWQAMLVDIAAISLLFLWKPSDIPFDNSRKRWGIICLAAYGLSGLIVAHAVLDYAPTGAMKQLRNDPRLGKKVHLTMKNASAGEVVQRIQAATGLQLELPDGAMKMGDINTTRAPAWAALEWVAHKQPDPSRWVKTADGYSLVRGARFGRILPWLLAGATLGGIVIGSPLLATSGDGPNDSQSKASCPPLEGPRENPS